MLSQASAMVAILLAQAIQETAPPEPTKPTPKLDDAEVTD